MVVIVGVDIRYKAIFECLDCGAKQAGSIAKYNSDELPADGELEATSHEMPVGWASYGLLGPFKCPKCAN